MMLVRYRQKISRLLSRYQKTLLYTFCKPHQNTSPVFIMGCGRSGTTMLLDVFQRDQRTEVLNENSPKIAHNYRLVPSRVLVAINNSTAPVLVMKPILNSFDSLALLRKHSNSKVIWVIRDYQDMVASSMKKFGTIVSNYMKDLVLHNKGDNWLCDGVPTKIREILYNIDSSGFNSYDWMGLVWWAVNNTILSSRLYDHDRFLFVRYESLVCKSNDNLRKIYTFIGLEYNNKFAKYIDSRSIGRGSTIHLHPQVEKMCSDLDDALSSTLKPSKC